jgi:hypothetical protein
MASWVIGAVAYQSTNVNYALFQQICKNLDKLNDA